MGLNAASNLPQLQGYSVPRLERMLSDSSFTQTRNNGINQTWNHIDGSEARIHAYGNQNTSVWRSANNAHVHKQDPLGKQFNDRGIPSRSPSETHIGIRNPADLPKVRDRPHGEGCR